MAAPLFLRYPTALRDARTPVVRKRTGMSVAELKRSMISSRWLMLAIAPVRHSDLPRSHRKNVCVRERERARARERERERGTAREPPPHKRGGGCAGACGDETDAATRIHNRPDTALHQRRRVRVRVRVHAHVRMRV